MNKQIEEMANDIAKICPDLDCCGQVNCITHIASSLSKMGYRKASDVVREIFEEIEKIAMHGVTSFGLCLMSMGEVAFAELKEKYTEGEG